MSLRWLLNSWVWWTSPYEWFMNKSRWTAIVWAKLINTYFISHGWYIAGYCPWTSQTTKIYRQNYQSPDRTTLPKLTFLSDSLQTGHSLCPQRRRSLVQQRRHVGWSHRPSAHSHVSWQYISHTSPSFPGAFTTDHFATCFSFLWFAMFNRQLNFCFFSQSVY